MGPLHNEHHPVSNEIISQNSRWMAASTSETPISCPNESLINNMYRGKGILGVHQGNSILVINMSRGGKV